MVQIGLDEYHWLMGAEPSVLAGSSIVLDGGDVVDVHITPADGDDERLEKLLIQRGIIPVECIPF